MIMRVIRWLALRRTMKEAKELYKKGDSIEEIAEKIWATPDLATGIIVLGISPEDLLKMIKDKVGKK